MRNLSEIPLSARVMAGVVVGALASATLLTAPPTHAQGAADTATPADAAPVKKAEPDKKTKDAARKAYKDGQKAFTDGKFEEAAASFRTANETLPSPHAMYWYAAALDKADPTDAKLAEKIAAFEAYLAEPEAEKVGAEMVPLAQTRLDELKAKAPAKVTLTWTPASATVTVDGAAQTGAPPLALELAPGAHKIAVTADGFLPKEVELTVAGSQQVEQAIELEAEPPPPPPVEATPAAPPPPPPPPPEKPSKTPAYVTLGIAGAGLAVGTIFGVMALDKKSEFDDNPTASTADEVERNALIADMSFGVAITLGVTGIVLLTSDETADAAARRLERLPHRAKLEVAPYASPFGGGATARLRF